MIVIAIVPCVVIAMDTIQPWKVCNVRSYSYMAIDLRAANDYIKPYY